MPQWSLTGTPLQNRVGDLYSLVKFLQADPFAFYFCKQCECKSLHWRFSDHSNCDDCGHKGMSHFCWWNREVLKPILSFGYQGEGKIAYTRLGLLLRFGRPFRCNIMTHSCSLARLLGGGGGPGHGSTMMLRRTKVDKVDELGLPPRVMHTRRDLFNDQVDGLAGRSVCVAAGRLNHRKFGRRCQEEDFYRSLYANTSTAFAAYVRAGTVLNHYAHIFVRAGV